MKHVYVLVRGDIEPRHQTVQAVHAGIEVGRELIEISELHPNLVVLTVEDEQDLMNWLRIIHQQGIDARLFHEEDMNDEATALATEPVEEDARRLFEELPLLH